jgi:hypothetical protein
MSFRLTGPAISAVWRTPSALAPGDRREPLEEKVVALFDPFRESRLRYLPGFGALPEQDRRRLFPRAEGLRDREIAGILAMSLGAVSLFLARSPACIARAAER